MIDAPFESAEAILEGREFDLIFTSPPYFDLEVFTTEGEQSIITHSTFDKWMVHFYLNLSTLRGNHWHPTEIW